MQTRIQTAIFSCLAGILMMTIATPSHAEDLEMVNRPVNISGLTGLLFTTVPYTQPSGKVEIAGSVLSESSVTPEYRIIEYPFSITVGMKNNAEVALKGSYFHIKEGPTGTATIYRQTGDLELSYKWNFLPQREYSIIPGAALIITGILPTEETSTRTMSSLTHWGMRIGFSAGTEITWKERILGVYADAQMAGQDLTESSMSDIYEVANAGVLFPISKYRNLQMFMEYSLVHGKDFTTLSGDDYTSLTYGLRLASERFNLTLGAQYLHKRSEMYNRSGRVGGIMSMKF
jgi:hypothetical protein